MNRCTVERDPSGKVTIIDCSPDRQAILGPLTRNICSRLRNALKDAATMNTIKQCLSSKGQDPGIIDDIMSCMVNNYCRNGTIKCTDDPTHCAADPKTAIPGENPPCADNPPGNSVTYLCNQCWPEPNSPWPFPPVCAPTVYTPPPSGSGPPTHQPTHPKPNKNGYVLCDLPSSDGREGHYILIHEMSHACGVAGGPTDPGGETTAERIACCLVGNIW